jgi:hypothetical protein
LRVQPANIYQVIYICDFPIYLPLCSLEQNILMLNYRKHTA